MPFRFEPISRSHPSSPSLSLPSTVAPSSVTVPLVAQHPRLVSLPLPIATQPVFPTDHFEQEVCVHGNPSLPNTRVALPPPARPRNAPLTRRPALATHRPPSAHRCPTPLTPRSVSPPIWSATRVGALLCWGKSSTSLWHLMIRTSSPNSIESIFSCFYSVASHLRERQERSYNQERSFARQEGFDTLFKIVTVGGVGMNSKHEVGLMFCIVDEKPDWC